MKAKLPVRVVLSFSFFDFGCAGVYTKHSDSLYDLATNTHNKPRQIVYQKDNVHGPSWVLIDPTHDIHYCLAISDNGELPETNWICIGVPEKYLPLFRCEYDSNVLQRLQSLPNYGLIRQHENVFYLELGKDWWEIIEEQTWVDQCLESFSLEDVNKATASAKGWAEHLSVSENKIKYFKPHHLLGPHIFLNSYRSHPKVGTKVYFEVTDLITDYSSELLPIAEKDTEKEDSQDLPTFWMRCEITFKDNTPQSYINLCCYGIHDVSLSIIQEISDLEANLEAGLMSPLTATSSDDEYQKALNFDDIEEDEEMGFLDGPGDEDDDDDSGGMGFLGIPDDDDYDEQGGIMDGDFDVVNKKNESHRDWTKVEVIDDEKVGEDNIQLYKVYWFNEDDPTWETEENCILFARKALEKYSKRTIDAGTSCGNLDLSALGDLGDDFPSDEEEEDSMGEIDFGGNFDGPDENEENEYDLEEYEGNIIEEESIVTIDGETIHSLKLKLRQIERIRKQLIRGKKVSTEQMKIVARKNEIEKKLEQAKIDNTFLPLKAKIQQQQQMELDAATNDAINKFAGPGDSPSGNMFNSAPKKKKRRRPHRKPALPKIEE